MKVLHGGDLALASKRFNIPVEDWIDLSTGINPQSYPITDIDVSAFQQLPYLKPTFIQAAHAYYMGKGGDALGKDNLLAVSGSQAVIQLLPICLPSLPVLVPEIGYQEHGVQWQQSGALVTVYPSKEITSAVKFIDQALAHNSCQHIVIINPNNPTGLTFTPGQLKQWAEKLGEGAYLIIDEAFIDTQPELSVLPQHFEQNMIVLRSFGKFYGLAGVRLGFVFANTVLIQTFKQQLGLWAINGPAQNIATRALTDETWQQQARIDIRRASRMSQSLFNSLFEGCQRVEHQGVTQSFYGELFSSYYLPIKHAENLFQFFAHRGVLLRLIEIGSEDALLRVGCIDPNNKKSMDKLKAVIDLCIAHLAE